MTPIIGRTGGLDNVTSSEQELVVLVTPVLVHPLEMCQTPPVPATSPDKIPRPGGSASANVVPRHQHRA